MCVCLNNHNLFQLKAFGSTKVCRIISKLKHFIFLENVLVCLFPTNIRYFRQKRPSFLTKGGKRGGKHTNSKFFLEKRQSKNFRPTYFSKLNRDPIEKNLYRFEDPHCNRGFWCALRSHQYPCYLIILWLKNSKNSRNRRLRHIKEKLGGWRLSEYLRLLFSLVSPISFSISTFIVNLSFHFRRRLGLGVRSALLRDHSYFLFLRLIICLNSAGNFT